MGHFKKNKFQKKKKKNKFRWFLNILFHLQCHITQVNSITIAVFDHFFFQVFQYLSISKFCTETLTEKSKAWCVTPTKIALGMSSALRGYIAPDLEELNLENNMNNMLMKKKKSAW